MSWCNGKKHMGSYDLSLFKDFETKVVQTYKDLITVKYRYKINIKLKNTKNKKLTHRHRDILELSLPCKANKKTKKEDICKEHLVSPKKMKSSQDTPGFVKRIEETVKENDEEQGA